MSRRTHRAFGPILAVTIGFLAGALFTGILLTTGPIESAASGRRVGDDCGEAALTGNPDPPNRPVAAVPVSRPAPESTLRRIGTDPIADLRDRQLAIPVRGVERGDLRSSFWKNADRIAFTRR
jgi:hypothetical protein